MNTSIEKGDIIAIKISKDLEPVAVEILKVTPDYEKPGNIVRFDYINRSEASPFRRVGYPSEIIRLIRKNPNPAPDPKEPRPYDDKRPGGPGVVTVNGKEYIEKDNTSNKNPSSIVNPNVTTQVHEAVTAPAKPVLRRGKTDKELKEGK